MPMHSRCSSLASYDITGVHPPAHAPAPPAYAARMPVDHPRCVPRSAPARAFSQPAARRTVELPKELPDSDQR